MISACFVSVLDPLMLASVYPIRSLTEKKHGEGKDGDEEDRESDE